MTAFKTNIDFNSKTFAANHAAMSEAATMTESAFERMQKSARLTASQHSLERGAKAFIEAARKSIENWR